MECAGCKFYKEVITDDELGECRINPPEIYFSEKEFLNDVDVLDKEVHQSIFLMTHFPVVLFNSWCGKFQAA